MKRLPWLTTLYIACFLVSCGVQTTQNGDGGATETVNAQVIISDSTVAVKIASETEVLADIMIFDNDYNPAIKKGFCDSVIAIPADSGVYFSKLSGKYNVIISNRLTQTSLAVNSIHVGASIADTIRDTLSCSGSIQGNVVYNKSFVSENSYIKVYISGTPYYTEADSSGAFLIQAIPPGTYFIGAMLPEKNDIKSKRSVGKEIEIKSLISTDSITLFFSE